MCVTHSKEKVEVEWINFECRWIKVNFDGEIKGNLGPSSDKDMARDWLHNTLVYVTQKCEI